MKAVAILFGILFAINSSEVNSMKSYRNHKVLSFRIENEAQLKELQSLELQHGVRKKEKN